MSIISGNSVSALLCEEVHFKPIVLSHQFKTEYQSSSSVGYPPWLPPLLLSVLLTLALVQVFALSSVLSEPAVLAASSGRSLERYLLQFFWMNSSSLDAQKPRILKALRTVYFPHRSPRQKTFINPIDHTSVMEWGPLPSGSPVLIV